MSNVERVERQQRIAARRTKRIKKMHRREILKTIGIALVGILWLYSTVILWSMI